MSRRPSASALARAGGRGTAPAAVTWRRVRARPGRTLLVSVGVAVAVAFLIGVAGGSVVSQDLALRRSLSSLPPAERVVRVSWSGEVSPGGYGPLDRDARRALRTLTGEPIAASLELTDVQLGRGLVKLGAADSLRGVVDLRSGRLPASCTNARCEVVQVGGTPVHTIDRYGVHLVVVGRGTLASLVTFGEGGLETQPTAGGERPEPVLLTTGVRGLAGITPLEPFNRNYTWSAELEPSTIHDWSVGKVLQAESREQAELEDESGEFSLAGPDDALSESKSEGDTASRRVLLVGSSAAMLLLAFAGITAGALRRDARAELRRLTTRGATRGQQWAFLGGEAIAAVIPGAIAGIALGTLADVLIAGREGLSAGDAVRHGLLTPASVALAGAGTLGAVVAVIFALRSAEPGTARGVRPVDMAAVGAVVALVLLLARGQGQAGSLGSGPAIALAATPLLASFAFCVLLGRLLGPAVRIALRSARDGPPTLLLALLTLHRSPGRTVGIVGFLAVSAGLATFGLSYRATLATSSSEQAAYAVPLDYSLQIGSALVEPSDVATLARYRSLAPGVGAWPILTQVAEVAGAAGTPDTPTVLGVPAAAFPLIHGWRSDFSAENPAELGRLLRPTGPVALRGATIPAGATMLELPARAVGAAVQPVFVVETKSGGADQLMPALATARSRVLRVAVPRADRGGRIIALQLELPSGVERAEAHQEAEGHNGSVGFAGTLQLGPLTASTPAGRVPVSSFAGWIGRAGVFPRRASGDLRVRYVINTSEEAMLRPRQPFDTRALPVVASPDVAATASPGGILELNFGDEVIRARLVAVAHRFPTTQASGESFVVADESSLASALGAGDLPSSIPDELWLSAPPAESARVGALLQRPPYSLLQLSSRSAIEASLRDDPLARGIVVSLLAAAVAAIVLALVGLALVTVSFLRDEGDTLFDLESQGVGPRALRACVRWRASGLAAIGLAAGIALGTAMVVLTGRLLALDATVSLPDPPLRRVMPWLLLGLAAVAFVVAAAALIELVLRIAHRRSAAGRGLTGESWAS